MVKATGLYPCVQVDAAGVPAVGQAGGDADRDDPGRRAGPELSRAPGPVGEAPGES